MDRPCGSDTVVEGGELLAQGEPKVGFGHPSVWRTHEPFHEVRRGAVPLVVVQERCETLLAR